MGWVPLVYLAVLLTAMVVFSGTRDFGRFLRVGQVAILLAPTLSMIALGHPRLRTRAEFAWLSEVSRARSAARATPVLARCWLGAQGGSPRTSASGLKARRRPCGARG
jgi:hypothetical protein